ncbi:MULTISPECIES: porin PorA family protein [Corynebacterium]|uniref:porin PorA family protein n=1 Tax=Corynebacterium TaxID=1716 RepID=UPI00178C4BF0|nr:MULTISPECIES: porin PorA family protein [Corynebacterium]
MARGSRTGSIVSLLIARVFLGAAVFFVALSFIIYTTWKFSEGSLPRSYATHVTTVPSIAVGSLAGGQTVSKESSVVLGEPADWENVTAEARTTVRSQEQLLYREEDSVILSRGTGYPVETASSRYTGGAPGLIVGSTLTHSSFVRVGLNYRFPPTAGKSSYPYFDTVLQASVPVDFVDAVDYHGEEVFTYHQEIGPVRVIGGYYAVERDITVEPFTGMIVDLKERPLWFTAPDTPTAEQRTAEFFAGASSVEGTVFSARFDWDEGTTSQQWAEAERKLSAFHAMRFTQYLSRTLSFLLLIAAAVTYLRARS